MPLAPHTPTTIPPGIKAGYLPATLGEQVCIRAIMPAKAAVANLADRSLQSHVPETQSQHTQQDESNRTQTSSFPHVVYRHWWQRRHLHATDGGTHSPANPQYDRCDTTNMRLPALRAQPAHPSAGSHAHTLNSILQRPAALPAALFSVRYLCAPVTVARIPGQPATPSNALLLIYINQYKHVLQLNLPPVADHCHCSGSGPTLSSHASQHSCHSCHVLS